jgi:hypothetical protein
VTLFVDLSDAFDIVCNHTMMCLDPKDDNMHDATDSDCLPDDMHEGIDDGAPQPRLRPSTPWRLKTSRRLVSRRLTSLGMLFSVCILFM